MCIGKNAAGYREERSRRRQQGMPASSPHAARQHKCCTLQRKLLISLTVAGFYSAVSQYAIISKSNNYLQDSKYIDSLYKYAYSFGWTGASNVASHVTWKPIDAKDWLPFITSAQPYNNMTPKLDVVWARGYYSAGLPHSERPIEYYNARGMSSKALPPTTFKKYFTPDQCGTIWIRIWDLREWVNTILPHARCGNGNMTIITSDEPWDVPDGVPNGIPKIIFQSHQIKAWYSTNVVVQDQPKLFPIPLGLPIHYGFPDSPDSADTVRTMDRLRLGAKPFAERNQSILYDVGTLGGSARRDRGRKAAKEALAKCPDGRIRIKPKGGPLETWPLVASHQFAIAPIGVGYDTFRVWEFLFFGTVPIVLSSPLDSMYIDAHVPIIIVKDWKEVCEWTEDDIGNLFQRFHKWIANSHMWLRPSLWVPRDQNQMDKLCDASPGCRSGGQFYNAKKLDDKKSTAMRNA